MRHADHRTERILFLDGLPNLQNVLEALQGDLDLELAAIVDVRAAIAHSEGIANSISRDLFKDILHGEEEHIYWLETQFSLIKDHWRRARHAEQDSELNQGHLPARSGGPSRTGVRPFLDGFVTARLYLILFPGMARMASRPPPRFVVRRHDDVSHRWRWLWWGLAWLASLLLLGLILRALDGRVTPLVSNHRQQRALLSQIDDLKQQVANLQRSAQVNAVATKALRGTLTQREEELSGLRADLGFYSRLVGGDAQRQGLKLQEVKLAPIANSRGWNLILSLTQSAKRGDETTGNATVSVEGLRGDKVITLDWSALGDAAQKDGLPFHFTYFQQLQGTIVLPGNFRPTRLRIHIQPASGAPVTRAVSWAAAMSGNITTAEGDHDAQP